MLRTENDGASAIATGRNRGVAHAATTAARRTAVAPSARIGRRVVARKRSLMVALVSQSPIAEQLARISHQVHVARAPSARQIGANGAPSDVGGLHSPLRSEARVRPEMACDWRSQQGPGEKCALGDEMSDITSGA